MEVEKHIVTTERRDIDIVDVTLLSIDEYRNCRAAIPSIYKYWWWLRSPGYYSDNAAYVNTDGGVNDFGYYVNYDEVAVRPALKIKNLDSFNLGDKFDLAGCTWTVISEDLALCDSVIGEVAFREDWRAKDANDYAKSDIKKWLGNWAAKNDLKISRKE